MKGKFSKEFSKEAVIAAAVFFMVQGHAIAGEVLRLKTASTLPMQDLSAQLARGLFVDQDAIFVVQFNQGISESDKEALALRGLQTLGYLPDDALIVRGKRGTVALSSAYVPTVRAVSPFRPEWKLSPDLFQGPGQREILISTFDERAARETLDRLRLISGVRVLAVDGRDLVVDADPSRLALIARIEGVEWIEPLPRIIEFTMPNLDAAAEAQAPGTSATPTGWESGTKIMNFEAAWDRGFRGEGQFVAVADTGLDSGKAETLHPDFQGNFHKGYAAGLGSETWEDPMGHGTHVAGSVLGNGRSSDGKIRGGAYGAKVVVMGLWSALLDNLAPGTNFTNIALPAYNDGARVHTNSWGSAQTSGAYDTLAVRVDEFTWKYPEMLVLFAAGNSGEDKNADGRIDENSMSSPGTAKNVLTVGASENYLLEGGIQRELGKLREGDKKWGVEPLKSDRLSDNADGIAAFSSRGPTADGRIKPEIVAPGTNIVSTRSLNPKASPLWGEFDKNYVYSGGTSMSTPLTAGAAAVMREFLIRDRKITRPSGALVKAALMHTAKDLYPGQYGIGVGQELPKRRPNVHEGYGRVDMAQAMSLNQSTTLVDEAAGLGKGETMNFTVSVPEGATLRATLTYTDAPGSVSAAKALVNDLDLQVMTPAGETVGPMDRVNNSELVELFNSKAGTYKVIVTGVNVPQGKNGKQPFALLVGAY